MDHEVIECLQQFQLTSKEGRIIQVRPTQREKILEECSLSLFGRFLTTKQINLRAAKNLLQNSWKFWADLKILEVGEGLLQFKFAMESQLQWVLHNRPWCSDNSVLLLQRWQKGLTVGNISFNLCPMWVQVWGLPFDLFFVEVGQDIGLALGRVVEVDCKGFTSDQARFLWIRVELPLDKPLHRGSQIKSPKGDVVWVAFKYERLVSFCFQCGLIGHEVKSCDKPRPEAMQAFEYREWMKAGNRRAEGGQQN